MKTLRIILLSVIATALSFSVRAQEAGKLPFTGTVQYRIAYESETVPAEQLAQQPAIAKLQMALDKVIFSMAENKILADANTHQVHTLVNLSAYGLGKYHLLQNEAELQEQFAELSDIKIEPTEETKNIFGYTAKLVKGGYKAGNTPIAIDIWIVENFCDQFFVSVTQAEIPGLQGFPLEYTVKTPDMTMTFTAHKLTYEELSPKTFNIPSSYKASTKEQMQKDLMEFMQQMQEMQMQQGMGM
ncbi:MAG: hypothetical protein J1F29_01610 [Lentimicrobiaceae bacterium]|nr:hypothetical protein [Lentimicrobiaceae bacterium]